MRPHLSLEEIGMMVQGACRTLTPTRDGIYIGSSPMLPFVVELDTDQHLITSYRALWRQKYHATIKGRDWALGSMMVRTSVFNSTLNGVGKEHAWRLTYRGTYNYSFGGNRETFDEDLVTARLYLVGNPEALDT